MSGFEIVGVILGGLPILIKVAEDYKKGLEPLARWHRYKFEFRAFVNDVDIEKQMFDALVDRLLQYTDLSTEQKKSLLSGQDADGWCEAEVGKALRQRLGESYDACMYLLEAMKSDMLKLQEILSLKDGSVDWARPEEDKWHYQRKRISHSFSRKGSETVASLVRNNRRFRDLLDVLDQKATTERPMSRRTHFKDTTWVKIFECIRRHASSLHAVLRSGWRCACESPHLATLQLQARSKGDCMTQFIMGFMVSSQHNKTLARQHQYEVTVKQPVTFKEQISTQDPFTSRTRPAADQNDYLIRLRSNITGKAQPGDSNYFAPRSLSAPKTSSNLAPRKTSLKIQASESQSSNSSDRIPLANQNSLPNKQLTSNFASIMKRIVWTDSLTRGKASARPIPLDTISLPAVDQPSADDTDHDLEIEDLCSTLFNTNSGVSYVGHLCCAACHRHEFRSLRNSNPIPENTELVSLDKFLDDSTNLKRLTRKQRFRLTVVVASSLLQLQSTPWITSKLDKANIFFQYDCCQGEVLTEQPYIRHLFYSSKQRVSLPPPNSGSMIENRIRERGMASNSNVNANSNKILECHETSSRSLNPATNPISKQQHSPTSSSRSARVAAKASLHQLGILLLELCFDQTIESIPLRNEFLINGVAHDQTDFLTALEWKSDVEDEAGEDFKFAVNNCFNFEVKPDWNDIKFTQSIYAGVVQHLEKALADLGWAEGG